MSAIAVVLPAQGPPVRQILTMLEPKMSVYFLVRFIGGFKLTFS